MKAREIQQYVLAWLIVAGFCGITVYLLHLVHSGAQIQDSTGAVFMLLGSVSSMAGAVVQYFFGSTKGSADKNEVIAGLAKEKKDGTPG